MEKNELPQKGIFFNGQVFDAYTFAADLIRKADKSLTLIDNYIDDTVFSLLNKRKDIDEEEIYHLGASLKDLGKKWFAFSKMNKESVESILKKTAISLECTPKSS